MGKKDKGKLKRNELKCPKGMRDFGPTQMAVRERVFNTITEVFKRHGAVCLETPTMELKKILTGKYGEDSKLIYDVADFQGEVLSLRYDLTVPFARYCAQNSIEKIKRYQIGRVYRRDEPSVERGRYREFYQCDFDYAGISAPLVPDAECIRILVEMLNKLEVGDFAVKINHRKLLDVMLRFCGAPADQFHTICSSIDKLDKQPWDDVKKELMGPKNLSEEFCDRLNELLVIEGTTIEKVSQLRAKFGEEDTEANSVLDEIVLFFKYVTAFLPESMKDVATFEIPLARGLDYYTGVIFEAVLTKSGMSLGSVAGGGRYDGLIGMFSSRPIPAVGFALGVERIFRIVEEKQNASGEVRENPANVCVACMGEKSDEDDGLFMEERMKIANELWENEIKAELTYISNPKMKKQLDAILRGGYPIAVMVGKEEIEGGLVSIKRFSNKKGDGEGKEEEQGGEKDPWVKVERSKMVETIQEMLC